MVSLVGLLFVVFACCDKQSRRRRKFSSDGEKKKKQRENDTRFFFLLHTENRNLRTVHDNKKGKTENPEQKQNSQPTSLPDRA
jgi:hypothetical protein